MKTNIPVVPIVSGTESWLVPEGADTWAEKIALDTDTSYAINLIGGVNRRYQGSLKMLTEDSVNGAGTRRFLLKVDLPVTRIEDGDTNQNGSCCCKDADKGEIPAVSVHVVVTVPKAIGDGIAVSDPDAIARVSAAIRLIQSALSSVTTEEVTNENRNVTGTVLGTNLVLTRTGDSTNSGRVSAPIEYVPSTGYVNVRYPVPKSAPIWGLIGGLRSMT